MVKFALIGATLVVITVILHATGTTAWLRVIGRRYADNDGLIRAGKTLHVLIGTVISLLVLHTLQIVIWAYAYLSIVPAGELDTLEEAVYFSFVTFTTLGYGDITLSEGWRLLSGIQALNGIMLVGWSTAMLFAVVQKSWQGMAHKLRGATAGN
jgi:voltage-gated potassium channel